MYNRHRDKIESGDFKNSNMTRTRMSNSNNPKKPIHVRHINEHAGEPLQMEDYLAQLWNGYTNGKTRIAGADVSTRSGSSYPYVNATIR